MENNFVVIEGNIGVGKTTLSTMLAKEYDAKLILEQFSDNPFLPKFYKEPDKYSFPLELSFLAERYHQLKDELAKQDLFKNGTVADYYFMKSLIFSKQNLADDEYSLYRKLFNIIYKNLPKPDVLVYLHANTNRLLDNIASRGRSYEHNISEEYLLKIQQAYFGFFKQQNDLRVLIIDTNKLNFVDNPQHYEFIKQTITEKSYPVGTTRLIPDFSKK